jgi:1-acyl-sn-glycerol-3-phosphate acyltransferase
MDRLRAALLLCGFFIVTLLMIPLQALLLTVRSGWSEELPHYYHRLLCWLLGLRVHVRGKVARDRPVLLISNHISWLDIIVISSLAPVHFIAKREVADWPFFGLLAKLQRSLFIDRERRTAVRETAHNIAARLKQGERMVLFAEGTSSDGNQILPFKSALIGAAALAAGEEGGGAAIQTLTLAYTRVHGLPMGRMSRTHVAWYGDMDMIPHVWGLLRQGPLDVDVRVSEPLRLENVRDRKKLAAISEAQVRRNFAGLLRGRVAAE